MLKINRRGFTLIELLAVIVVLAIIALIAAPIVMNVIKRVQESSVERGAKRYLDAVELAIASSVMNGQIEDGLYIIQSDGSLCLEGQDCTEQPTIEVNVKGNIPSIGGKIAIENGMIVGSLTGDHTKKTAMQIGDYTITIDKDGAIVFDSTESGGEVTNKLCHVSKTITNYIVGDYYYSTDIFVEGAEEVGKLATENAKYELGTEYKCNFGDGVERTFYVLEDGDNTTLTKGATGTAGTNEVALIMDRNIDDEKVAWCGDEIRCKKDNAWNHSAGPLTVIDALNEKTSRWTNSQILDITLPTYGQLEIAKNSSSYSWIYVNLRDEVNIRTYWTASPSNSSTHAWYIFHTGGFYGTYIQMINSGVRPVIVVSKDSIS